MYADYKDQSNQTLVPILGSVLRQFLTSAHAPIPDEVIHKLRNIQRQGTKIKTEDILALLKIRLHQLKCAFICIDAVDELEPKVRQQVLNILKELVVSNKNTRLFLTARGHVKNEVEKRFNVAPEYRAEINASRQDL